MSQQHPTLSYPQPGYAWYMVVLLLIAYIFSFLDRTILGLLVEPIKTDLGLSDTQIGLLLGPAFGLFYATMGLPLGWLADRQRRTWIIGIGCALWSFATAMSGIARSFLHLFTARMAVGVGEATLSPCAMTMITDSFPREKRALPVAIYSTAMSFGMAIAFLGGATIIAWANSVGTIDGGILGELNGWRLTFIIVGVPGLILAPMLFFLREPHRMEQGGKINKEDASIKKTFGYVKNNLGTLSCFITIFCLMTILGYSHFWNAALFGRTWGWSPAEFGFASGLLYLFFGPVTVSVSGWVVQKMQGEGRHDAPLLIPAYGAVVSTIGSILFPLMPSAPLALACLAIALVGLAMSTSTGVLALMNITPAAIRGQVVAVYYMAISVAGLMLGPSSVGVMNDFVFGTENLRYSMAVLPVIFGIPTCLLIPLTMKLYRRELDAQNEAEAVPQPAE